MNQEELRKRYYKVLDEITEQYLLDHPNEVFVFGDNCLHYGTGGAAKLRYLPNTYGFMTKRRPANEDKDFFTPLEYCPVYIDELARLMDELMDNPDKTYLISPIGSGLANRFHIWEKIIEPTIKHILGQYPNVRFLW